MRSETVIGRSRAAEIRRAMPQLLDKQGVTAMSCNWGCKVRVGLGSCALGLVALVSSAALASPDENAGGLTEVLVTARKRSENLQNVPTAVSAVDVSSASAQQLTDYRDLSASVPSLIVYPNTANTNSAAVFIRGLGQDDSTAVQEPQVALYVDDVYMPRAQGGILDLGDFERIEVLRGPQGTLYGRNSDGGAIKYVTVKPSLTEASGSADLAVGSFRRADVHASYTTPLVENRLGVKIDVVSRDRDGYVYQVGTGKDFERVDRQAARIALRFAPTGDITWDFAVDGSHDKSGLQAPVPIAPTPGGGLGGYAPLYGSFYVTGADATDKNNTSTWGMANTIAWDSPIGTLKSVTSYRRITNSLFAPLAGLPGPAGQTLIRDFDDRDATQEFQITSKADLPLTYVAGLFFLSESFHNKDQFFILDDYVQTTKSYAAYGELTYKLTPAVNVTAGARFTEDKKSLTGNYIGLGGPFSVSDFGLSSHNFSPKASIDYRISDQTLLYGSVTAGYQGGGYQGFPQALTDVTVQTIKPAKVTSYEVGTKTELWDRRARINLAVFYALLRDKQVSAFNVASLTYVSNTVDETLKGAELEFNLRLNSQFSVTGFASWLDAYVTHSGYPANPLVPPSGAKAAYVSDYMGKIGVAWDQPLTSSGAHLFADANVQAVGKIYYDIFNTPFAAQKARQLVDARVGYRTAGGRLEIALGGQNLSNVQWFSNASTNGTIWPMPPRTWSLSFKFKQ